MLRSTLGAFLPSLRLAHAASDSDSASAFSCLRLKDFREEVEKEPKDILEIRKSHTMVSNRNNNSRRVEQSNCSSSVVETTNTSTLTTSSTSCSFPPSSSSFSAPRSMWQEAIRRKQYLLNQTGESSEGDRGGGQEKRNRSPDWLYESYYCMSQQHPLIVFLLLIVMGACLALLTVFFASGLVSCSFSTQKHTHMHTHSLLTCETQYKLSYSQITLNAHARTHAICNPHRSTNVKRRVR